MKVKIREVCSIISGTTPKTDCIDYWDGSLNWITPAELIDTSDVIYDTKRKITAQAVKDTNLKLMPTGTVILSSRAPIGKVAIAGTPMYCNQGFKNLVCSSSIYNRYLFHFLKSKREYLNSLGRGATFKEISKKIVENIEIPLPSLEKQHQVAEILDQINILIAKRNEQYNKLNELIKSRFKKLANAFKDNKMSLASCCTINPVKPKDIADDLDCTFIPMSSVSNTGNVNTDYIKPYKDLQKGFTYFAENDVLFAKITPCMENGKGCIAKNLYNKIGFGSTEFHVLRPDCNKINPYWLYILTIMKEFRLKAALNMTGSARQRRVPASFLQKYAAVVPDMYVQNQFANFVIATDTLKAEIQNSLAKLETLKKSLMQEYFA